MRHLAATPLNDLTEREWQNQVISLAKQTGWKRRYHTHDSRKSAYGFPDWVFVRERVIYLELKREKTKVTDEQRGWLLALHTAGAEVYVARPADLVTLGAILAARHPDRDHPPLLALRATLIREVRRIAA